MQGAGAFRMLERQVLFAHTLTTHTDAFAHMRSQGFKTTTFEKSSKTWKTKTKKIVKMNETKVTRMGRPNKMRNWLNCCVVQSASLQTCRLLTPSTAAVHRHAIHFIVNRVQFIW